MPVDLETTELLFTSLLVQAGRAMNVAAAAGGAHARSAAFRRSFLRSFGWRIGERLIAARSKPPPRRPKRRESTCCRS
jgi:hypothetical protein